MSNPVLILYLEDNPRDAELVRQKLQTDMACELQTACCRAEYEAALAQKRFDLILSDYRLPDYDGMTALAFAREKQPDVPFILISGTLGDEQAVDCMRLGATDYVLKERLGRLVPAALRALAEAEEHTRRRKVEASLRESQEQFRVAQELSPDGFTILRPVRDARGRVVDFIWVYENAAIACMNGTEPEAVVGRRLLELFPSHQDSQFLKAYQRVAETGEGCVLEDSYRGETIASTMWVRIAVVPTGGDIAVLAQDITEHKVTEEHIRIQLDELRRWKDVTVGREDRVQELKREVNELSRRAGQAARYPSEEAASPDAGNEPHDIGKVQP